MDVNSIQLLETKEDEEGNVIMSFDMDDESSKMMGELGLKFLLYCGALDISTEEAFEILGKEIDKKNEEYTKQDSYEVDGIYGENHYA
jgi:hypothetical protein